MRFAIIGAGAMGSLFGGYLAKNGIEVWLLDIWEEHISTIRQDGLRVVAGETEFTAWPNAVTSPCDIPLVDVVVIFVKSYATNAVAKTAKRMIGDSGVMLTLQNGLGNIEMLAGEIGAERLIAGTTSQGAAMVAPGVVRHGGRGSTHIAAMNGCQTNVVEKIARIFNKVGIDTTVEREVTSFIWEKLLINVGINALTAITGLRNGDLLKYDETREIMRMAVQEAEQVARFNEVVLPYQDVFVKVCAVAEVTAQNRSSMLEDVANCRMTEIESINGAIVREGEKAGLPVPVNKMLTLLVETFGKINANSD